jgi:ubiquinone biosynthesis protein COQ9
MPDHSPHTAPVSATVQILAAALPHVAFDGWSQATLDAALRDTGHAKALGIGLFPRGGVDLATAYHRAGDEAMRDAVAASDLAALRYRDKIAAVIRLRLGVADKEAVRKAAALFALPRYAPEGAALIWGTSDAIWQALGDTSRDVNWYTKRATLAAVYSSTVLYWLGDTSDQDTDTVAFIDRRIENVMSFEKVKANLRGNPVFNALAKGPMKILERISMPERRSDMPGRSR